ncbi:MAG: DNA repair helicase XPB [Chloroflexota bacterium]|nr:helicase-associated domain-containing protein [Chloroflexota bacterium]
MSYNPVNPLIIQSDRSVLLEVNNPLYESARDELSRFAELEKSPEYIHTYRITPLSLWNAAAAGMGADIIVQALERYSKFPMPGNVSADIRDYILRYGRVKLLYENGKMVLKSEDKLLLVEVERNKNLQPFLLGRLDEFNLQVDPAHRGSIKQVMVQFGYPVEDLAGYVDGAALQIALRNPTITGRNFGLRDYQADAVGTFYAEGSYSGGSGVIVLPCGAGKTVVGMGVIEKLQCHTLILTPSTIAVRQWISEILDKSSISPDEIGEYTADKKEIKPITVTTYQIVTYRPYGVNKDTGEIGEFPHLSLFTKHDWGLIIYDEVHLLPAPVFRVTAEIQARRRLGLTATLVREDGRETDVFSLIGPKKYDMPWKDLEQEGWIATAECCEIRVELPPAERLEYVLEEDNRVKYHLSAVNSRKYEVLTAILDRHTDDHVLVIGQYIEQLKHIAQMLQAPLITGKTNNQERSVLYGKFKRGEIKLLVVSRVANFAIDLPDANVAIQVSGLFGSRQEEAQRLGRILRPKANGASAYFYSIVTRDTKDQDFASNRQLFLTEQGYRYSIIDARELLGEIQEGHFREIPLHELPAPTLALPSGSSEADGLVVELASPLPPLTLPAAAEDEDSPEEEAAEFAEVERTLDESRKAKEASAEPEVSSSEKRSRGHLRVVK